MTEKYQSPHSLTQGEKHFLNILKIFQITIEVYGKKIKWECIKHKLRWFENLKVISD